MNRENKSKFVIEKLNSWIVTAKLLNFKSAIKKDHNTKLEYKFTTRNYYTNIKVELINNIAQLIQVEILNMNPSENILLNFHAASSNIDLNMDFLEYHFELLCKEYTT